MFRIACGLAAMAMALTASAVKPSSSSVIVPGEWTSNFKAAKAYAEETHTPMFVYWSTKDCGFCKPVREAFASTQFAVWSARRKIVLVYCEGDSHSDCENFARNKQMALPYLAVYWPKEDGTEAKSKFIGRKGAMLVKKGPVEDQLTGSIDKCIYGWSPDGGVSIVGVTPDPGPLFTRATTLTSAVRNGNDVIGLMSVKVGKGGKDGFSKVSGWVTDLYGKKHNATAVKVYACEYPVRATLTVQDLGEYSIEIEADGVHSSSDSAQTITPAGSVGTLADGIHAAKLTDVPQIAGATIVSEALPNQEFEVSGKKWSFPKACGVKMKDGLVVFDETPTKTNRSGLKLSCTASTGVVKGSFNLYAIQSGKLKKHKATVTGLVVDGVAACRATIKDVGVFALEIE